METMDRLIHNNKVFISSLLDDVGIGMDIEEVSSDRCLLLSFYHKSNSPTCIYIHIERRERGIILGYTTKRSQSFSILKDPIYLIPSNRHFAMELSDYIKRVTYRQFHSYYDKSIEALDRYAFDKGYKKEKVEEAIKYISPNNQIIVVECKEMAEMLLQAFPNNLSKNEETVMRYLSPNAKTILNTFKSLEKYLHE